MLKPCECVQSGETHAKGEGAMAGKTITRQELSDAVYQKVGQIQRD
jgi:hypothetical protein